jgi:hypothetical protein
MDFPITELMDQDACYAKFVAFINNYMRIFAIYIYDDRMGGRRCSTSAGADAGAR